MRTEMTTAYTEFRVELLDDVLYVVWEWQPEEGDGDQEILAEITLETLDPNEATIRRALLNEGWLFTPGESVSDLADNAVGTVVPSTAALLELWQQAEWALYRARSKAHMANDALRTLFDDRDAALVAITADLGYPADAVEELFVAEVWE